MKTPIDFATRKPIDPATRLPQTPYRSRYDVFVGTVQQAWEMWIENPQIFEDVYGWGFADPVAV